MKGAPKQVRFVDQTEDDGNIAAQQNQYNSRLRSYDKKDTWTKTTTIRPFNFLTDQRKQKLIPKYNGPKFIDISKIQDALNGYARVIEFTCSKEEFDLQKLHVKFLNEGQYLKGQFEGFGRSIDANGTSQEGFWKRQQITLLKNEQKKF